MKIEDTARMKTLGVKSVDEQVVLISLVRSKIYQTFFHSTSERFPFRVSKKEEGETCVVLEELPSQGMYYHNSHSIYRLLYRTIDATNP